MTVTLFVKAVQMQATKCIQGQGQENLLKVSEHQNGMEGEVI